VNRTGCAHEVEHPWTGRLSRRMYVIWSMRVVARPVHPSVKY
jgi:hypothetical protein